MFKKTREARNRLLKRQQYYLNPINGAKAHLLIRSLLSLILNKCSLTYNGYKCDEIVMA